MTELNQTSLVDENLEQDIQNAFEAALNAPDREQRFIHLNHLMSLVRQRSPEQIARMEREAGLSG